MKKVIIQVVQHMRIGGIETMALELARSAGNEYDMRIVSLEGTKDEAIKAWPMLQDVEDKLIFLNKKPKLSFSTLVKLWKLCVILRPKAVHVHHVGPLLYAGIAARCAGVKKLIYTEHDVWHLEDEHVYKIESGLLKILRPNVVADSCAISEGLHHLWPEMKHFVIPNGVDTTKFVPGFGEQARELLRLPVGVPIIGCAGRMEEVKNHSLLLEAFALLPSSYRLALAGDGSLRLNLQEQAKRLDISHRVHYLGHQDDMAPFYRAIDVFCLPSSKEGLPLSLLEAQSSGVPVVASDVGACCEAICAKTGAVFASNNAESLARVLANSVGFDFTASPREFVEERFSLSQMTKGYLALAEGRVI